MRKLRRDFTKRYWNIWKKGYSFYLENKKKTPQNIQMMLNYGFFDEELLDKEHLDYILKLSSTESNTNFNIPILSVTEWLDLIYNKVEKPSINELGQSYFEKLRMENKHKNWKRESNVPEEFDTKEKTLKL